MEHKISELQIFEPTRLGTKFKRFQIILCANIIRKQKHCLQLSLTTIMRGLHSIENDIKNWNYDTGIEIRRLEGNQQDNARHFPFLPD